MGRYDKNLEDHEYFFRHFNTDVDEEAEVDGTVCLAVNKTTKKAVAAASVVHRNDQFSKKIGRSISQGRANQLIMDPGASISDLTQVIEYVGEDPREALYALHLSSGNNSVKLE